MGLMDRDYWRERHNPRLKEKTKRTMEELQKGLDESERKTTQSQKRRAASETGKAKSSRANWWMLAMGLTLIAWAVVKVLRHYR